MSTALINQVLDLNVKLLGLVNQKRLMAMAKSVQLVNRQTSVEVYLKQFEETEEGLTEALRPIFSKQLSDASKALEELETRSKDVAEELANQIFDPREYDDDLVNAAFPVLARGMVEAALAQLLMLGVDISQKSVGYRGTKVTTASEWLESSGEELPPGLVTDVPEWMQSEVGNQLRESFDQPWWKSVNDTTQSDIENFLRGGIQKGETVRDLAKGLIQINSEYSLNRAKRIARTELGNALNGARKLAVDKIKEEVPEVELVQVWLSVLGFTTRDAHADLDGMEEDADGLWNLNGVLVPWPSHFTLPAEDRVNCQCSLVSEFKVDEEEMRAAVGNASGRIMG